MYVGLETWTSTICIMTWNGKFQAFKVYKYLCMHIYLYVYTHAYI